MSANFAENRQQPEHTLNMSNGPSKLHKWIPMQLARLIPETFHNVLEALNRATQAARRKNARWGHNSRRRGHRSPIFRSKQTADEEAYLTEQVPVKRTVVGRGSDGMSGEHVSTETWIRLHAAMARALLEYPEWNGAEDDCKYTRVKEAVEDLRGALSKLRG